MVRLYQLRKKYGGKIEEIELPLHELVVTRPWVHQNKVKKYRNFNGNGDYKRAGVVITEDGMKYLIDGHHRSIANYLDGDDEILSQILIGAERRIKLVLERRNHGSIDNLAKNSNLLTV